MRQKTNFDIKTGFSKMQSYSAVYVCAMLLCACWIKSEKLVAGAETTNCLYILFMVYFCKYIKLSEVVLFFPECVARVPVSFWGSGGWGCVGSTLRLCLQLFATVRSRPQPSARAAWPCLWRVLQKGHFWGFQTSRSVSHGRRGTLWHSDMFHNVTKVVLCGKRNTFCDLFKRCVVVIMAARSTLDVSILILPGRRSTLDVSSGSFFANSIVRAAWSGDKVQIPVRAWHFVRYAENWRNPRTKHRFWSCKFWGSKENS